MKAQLIKFLLSIVIIITFGAPTGVLAQTVSLTADQWFPYNGDPASDQPGYMVEIARSIFKEKGLRVDYQTAPWTRSIALVESGAMDGIIGTGKGDTPGFVFPSEPIAVARYAVFTLANSSWSYRDTESLREITLGVVADYSYAATMDNYLRNVGVDSNLVQYSRGDDALERNIEKLRRGRIGGLVSNPEVLYATLDALNIPRTALRQAVLMPEADPLYIAFSPRKESSEQYARILSEGIRAMRKDGELARILARYRLQDWAP